jgi:2,3-bisphosphoglycerate-independent phosphoglycerate mutase
MRQITKAFLDPEFSAFPITPIPNLYVATMTQYHDTSLPAHIAFPNEEINETLGKVISDSGRRQLRIAETQKYAHVTYFFNGLHNEPYPEEYRVLIPSLDTPHPESAPAMMASAITDRALSAIQEGVFDLIVMNYANPDILAHTGNFQATLEAIHIVDKELARLVNATLNGGHTLIITSDHGNAEVVLDMKTGNPETRHNISPVPFYIINNSYRKPVPLERSPRLQTVGLLSDVAPTILEIFGIDKPEEMTGESVLNQLLY